MDFDSENQKYSAVRRRPFPKQGKALEVLAHAIEYLLDSYVIIKAEDSGVADAEAVQILVRLNRQVFAECPEVIPWYRQGALGHVLSLCAHPLSWPDRGIRHLESEREERKGWDI